MDALALGIVHAHGLILCVLLVRYGLGLDSRLGLRQRGGEEVVVGGFWGCDDGEHG